MLKLVLTRAQKLPAWLVGAPWEILLHPFAA
jgi:hypothetical protein